MDNQKFNNNDSILFSEAVQQFLYAKQSQRLSPHTLRDYERTFRKFLDTLPANIPVSEITPIIFESLWLR